MKLSDPRQLLDGFDSDDDSDQPVEDEHHDGRTIFDCPGYVYAREHFRITFVSTNLLTSLSATGWPGSLITCRHFRDLYQDAHVTMQCSVWQQGPKVCLPLPSCHSQLG